MQIALTMVGRLSDRQRVPNKLLTEFDKHPLIEFQLLKLSQAAKFVPDVTPIFFVYPEFEPLVRAANFAKVEIIPLPESTLWAERSTELFSPVRGIVQERFDMVVVVNPCLPFIRLCDFILWIALCMEGKSMYPVFARRNWVLDGDLNRLDNDIEPYSTRAGFLYHVPASSHVIYSAEEIGTLRGLSSPYVVSSAGRYMVDIDTPEDLKLAQSLWLGGYCNMPKLVASLYR